MTIETFLNNASQPAIVPVHILAGLNRIDSVTSSTIVFGSSFDTLNSLRATGSGITSDALGKINGGLITQIEFLTDGLVQMRLTGFAPLAAVAAAASFTGGSLPGYDQLIALLFDATTVTGSFVNDWIDVGAGNDSVSADGGDDRVSKFLAGNLVYDGGDGVDTLNLGAENGLIYPTPFIRMFEVNLTTGVGVSPYGGVFALTSVENVIGTNEADRIIGSSAANVTGDGMFDRGADYIRTLGGNDTVKVNVAVRGVDADGGTGSDTIWIETMGAVAGLNVIDLENSAANTGVFARNRFTQFENVTFSQSRAESRLDFRGSAVANTIYGGAGNDRIDGRGGADFMVGGDGDDMFTVDRSTDFVFEYFGQGEDTVLAAASFAIGNDIENLTLTGSADLHATGNDMNNKIRGNAGANVIIGGGGRDMLYGGAGDDLFRFNSTSDSGLVAALRDAIVDFAPGDKIDLRGIDANIFENGNQAFRFDAGGDFSVGEVRAVESGDHFVVSIRTGAATGADFSINVYGAASLSAADFLL